MLGWINMNKRNLLRKHADEVEKIVADLYIIMGKLFAKASKDV